MTAKLLLVLETLICYILLSFMEK